MALDKNKAHSYNDNVDGICNECGIERAAVEHRQVTHMFRMYNPNATVGAYHFTFSEEEKQNLINAGWEYQGIGWYSCWK